MSVFLAPLLSFLQTYGYPMLGMTIFVAALGAPLPIALMLLAAGAFAAQGDFNVVLLAVIATSASVAGDSAGYLVGRVWGSKVLSWLPRSRLGGRFITAHMVERSRRSFHRHGGWAVFLTRFLVSGLGSVTNLVAGTELFSFRTFLVCDVSGEALGAMIPLVLGFIVGASWEAVGDILGAVSLLALVVPVVVVLAQRLLSDLTRDMALRRHAKRQGSDVRLAAHRDE